MRKLEGISSYNEWEVEELRKDREFAVEYLRDTGANLRRRASRN